MALVFWTIVSVSFTNSSYLSKVYIKISLPRVEVRWRERERVFARTSLNKLMRRCAKLVGLETAASWSPSITSLLQSSALIEHLLAMRRRREHMSQVEEGFVTSLSYLPMTRSRKLLTWANIPPLHFHMFWPFREETLPYAVVNDTQTPPGVPSPSPWCPESQGMCFWFRSLAACDSWRFRAWQIQKVFWCTISRLGSSLCIYAHELSLPPGLLAVRLDSEKHLGHIIEFKI